MEDRYELLESFLDTWPVSRVKEMKLEQYSNLNKSDSFCYWLEALTTDLGSIWGGSAFKFGIYEKNQKKTSFTSSGRLSDNEYAWLKKYGESREEAFQNVKNIILSIISAVHKNDYKTIDGIDLGDATKWKIAFLYSDNKILNIFNKVKLNKIAEVLGIAVDIKISFSDLQKTILESKPEEEDFFDYSARIWDLDKGKTQKKYWIYSPGEQACKWEEFYDENIMALGWDELGDLSQYSTKKSLTKKLQEVYDDKSSQKNNATANFSFANDMNIGDIVIVKKGLHILLGYGEVTSDYYYSVDRENYKHCRDISWKKNGEWNVSNSMVLKTLTEITSYNTEKVPDKKYYQYLLDIMENKIDNDLTSSKEVIKLLLYKKQIILQGPPGTGKTREAELIAKEMLGLSDIKDLENNEQYKLVQFHPSYTYEDFVRGIVAKPTEDGNGILYEAENKTLGKFAKNALDNFLVSKGIIQNDNFESRLQILIDEVNSKVIKGDVYSFGDKSSAEIFAVGNDYFYYSFPSRKEIRYKLLFSDLKKIFQNKSEISIPIDLRDKEKDFQLTMKGKYPFYFMVLRTLESYKFKADNDGNVELKKYVLVIDEINRANLSSVLGELIYALEYREKEVESMYEVEGSHKLILPPNLYIIGTMNTADRSVGHIDYAIRRRFAFVDVPPENLKITQGLQEFDDNLFEKVAAIFDTNLSPEFKKEDVQLGHSYFIDKTEDGGTMAIRLQYEIKPILLEYVKDGILVGEMSDSVSVEDYINSLTTS